MSISTDQAIEARVWIKALREKRKRDSAQESLIFFQRTKETLRISNVDRVKDACVGCQLVETLRDVLTVTFKRRVQKERSQICSDLAP